MCVYCKKEGKREEMSMLSRIRPKNSANSFVLSLCPMAEWPKKASISLSLPLSVRLNLPPTRHSADSRLRVLGRKSLVRESRDQIAQTLSVQGGWPHGTSQAAGDRGGGMPTRTCGALMRVQWLVGEVAQQLCKLATRATAAAAGRGGRAGRGSGAGLLGGLHL